jgi:hypothetical protein
VSLEELEDIRKKVLLHSRGFLLLGWVLVLLGLGGGWRSFLLLIGIFLINFARLQVYLLRMGLKKALVSPIAEALGFRYSPEKGFSREEILASGLFSPPDDHDAEDLVEGEVNGIPFALSDIALYSKVKVVINNVTTDQYEEFFRGTLYRFQLPFSVQGEVRFGPRGRRIQVVYKLPFFVGTFIYVVGLIMLIVGVLFGGANTRDVLLFGVLWVLSIFPILASTIRIKKGFEGSNRVVLESPEFERFYDAYGDQIEARKLLTPRVQEALVRLRKYFGKPIWGAVRERYLWLAIEGKDRFPVPILRPVSDTFEAQKVRYQEELLQVSRVVETLKLEEEAKRRGAWRRKIFLGLDELSSAPKKNATFDGDEPQQTEDAPTRKYRLFGR